MWRRYVGGAVFGCILGSWTVANVVLAIRFSSAVDHEIARSKELDKGIFYTKEESETSRKETKNFDKHCGDL